MNNDIHHFIDLYFAGETTLQQERRLRKLLLENAGSGDPAVEEALAVMSFTAASRPAKRASRTPVMHPLMRLAGMAAAVAVVATLVFRVAGVHGDSADMGACVAYIGNHKVDDRDKIMELVESDWAEISAASAEINNDVSAELSIMFESTEN